MIGAMTPDELLARLLYRDGLMLVIDKPAGLPVHRGPKGGESLEDHFGALRFGLPRAPALAHRLDRETSGCLVLGRHRKALATLGRLFKSGAVGKTYWAVVEGGPTEDEGTIDLSLGRRDATRGWWMRPDPAGQPAVTRWKVLGRVHPASTISGQRLSGAHAATFPPPLWGMDREGSDNERRILGHPPPTRGEGADPSRGEVIDSPRDQIGASRAITWLALEPVTGRTHQLRVHCAALGFPIVGDSIYGTQASLRSLRKEDAPRTGGPALHLHSREIVVPLYKNRAPIAVTAPVPLPLQERLYACGWQGEVFRLLD